jgi:exonuclease SbcC
MITSLYLKNWRSHKETRINFGGGINVIHGIIGSGKSSIMDAISFALFGTFPSLQSKRMKLSQLISNFSKEQKAMIELEFENDGKRYLVKREISENSTSAQLFCNGSLLQTQTSKVTEEIEKLLGINYELFSRAIYSEQNGLEYFLNLSPAQRKNAIDELLGLDRFESVRSSTVYIIRRLKDELDKEKEELKGLNEKELRKTLEEISSKKESIEKEIFSLEKQLEILKKEVEELKKEKDEKNRLLDLKQKLERECSSIQGQIAFIQNKIKSIAYKKEEIKEKKQELKKQKEEKVKELEEKNFQLATLNKKIGKEEERLRQETEKKKEAIENEKRIKELEEKNVEEQYRKIEEEIEELKKESFFLKGSLKITQIGLEELSKEISKCPICESPLSESKRKELFEKKSEEKKQIEQKIEENEEKLKEAQKNLQKINELKQEFEFRKSKAKTIVFTEPQEIEKEIENLKNEAEEKRKELEALTKEKEMIESELKKIEDFEILFEQLQKLEEELRIKTEELQKIKITKEEVERVNEEFTKKSSEKAKMEERVFGSKEILKELEKREKLAKEELQKIEEKKAWIGVRTKTIEEFSKFENAVVKTQERLRKVLIEAINEKMQEIWEELYPYGDFSEIKLEATEDDYQLLLKAGDWVNFNLVSGGERSLAALTMRMAISLVLVPKLSWIILDEPTHNMDRNSIELMAKVFREKISQMVEQVFIITHDEILKQAATSKLILLERDKKNNLPTTVKEYSLT